MLKAIRMRGLTYLLLGLFACVATAFPARADKRVALIIGNSAYEHADKLANPVRDSRNLRDVLQKIGFDEANIVYGEDLGKRDMERAIGRFAILARDADVALTYYAGHGATFGDTPYIVPVDARFETIDQMPYELEPLEAMVGELRKARGVRIAIVDACRDNTAERSLKRTDARGGEITRGLARLPDVDGLIVAYATQYLATAEDGPNGTDSPFTAALLKHLPTPGLDVKDLFFEVGREVLATTKGRQRREVKISFYEKYALVAPPPQEPGVAVAVPLPVLSAVIVPPAPSAQQLAFDAAMQADAPPALEAYLAKFPDGALADIARREKDRLVRLAALPLPVPAPVVAVPVVPVPGVARPVVAQLPPSLPPVPVLLPAAPPTAAPPPAVVAKQDGGVHALNDGNAGAPAVSPVLPQSATPTRQYMLPEGAKLVAVIEDVNTLSVAYAPDGRTLAAAKSDGSVQLWDAASGKLQFNLSGLGGAVNGIAFSPDGSAIVAAGSDRTLKLWDVRSGKVLRTLATAGSAIQAVSFAPDGKSVVSGTQDGSVKLWDADSGTLLRSFAGQTRPVMAVAFSPDSKTILSGGSDRKLKLWDATSGKLVQNLSGAGLDISSVAFSLDGSLLLSCARGESLSLWSAANGKLLRSFASLPGHSVSAAFSPDGEKIVSGGDDFSVRLWDAITGKLLRTLDGHAAPVNSVAFAPNGRTIVSGSADGTVKLWDATSGMLMATYFTVGKNGVAYTPAGHFVTDADPRQAFAIKRGDERLPLDDFIAANRRQVLSRAAAAQ